jgi:hypothetical protein
MYKLPLLLFILIFSSEIPSINKKVVEYVDTVIGKKVGRGECWDLASAALEHAGGYLDRSSQKSIYVFGKEINPTKQAVFPGDILQIENVKLEYAHGNMIYTENMSHHTAIIYEVISPGHFKIAHQNTSFSGRKVGISELKMENIKNGKVIFYRPHKK